MAFYHVSTSICDHASSVGWRIDQESVKALTEIFSTLAMGSAFWHGSHTTLGNVFDNQVIAILSWIGYQVISKILAQILVQELFNLGQCDCNCSCILQTK